VTQFHGAPAGHIIQNAIGGRRRSKDEGPTAQEE
jgi:hypothetical protein